jgi:hypothetical protein
LGSSGSQFLSIPIIQVLATGPLIDTLGHVQNQTLTVELYLSTARSLHNPKSRSATPNVMRLTGDHLAKRLALCILHFPTTSSDPSEALDNGQPNLFLV